MSIEVKNINKSFGNFVALNNVSLDFPSGELVALLGPSGCGKTTLLRIIAGLETPDSGNIILDGVDTSLTPVRDRQVGFVFQHYALFKHMTVFDNVAFGLNVKSRKERPSKDEIAHKVHELLKLVQLDWLHDRFPAQLSGGQRQRLAIARALVKKPEILIFDDSFSALDLSTDARLRHALSNQTHRTTKVVVGQRVASIKDADQILVLEDGRLVGRGTHQELLASNETYQEIVSSQMSAEEAA